MEQAMWLLFGGGVGALFTFLVMLAATSKMANMVGFLIERVADLIETVEDRLIEDMDEHEDDDNEDDGDSWKRTY